MKAEYRNLTLATIFAATSLAAALPAAAQTQSNEVLMSDNPSYCEVYNALSQTAAEECQQEGTAKTRGLTLTGTTQGLAITNTSQSGGTATAATTQTTGTIAANSGPTGAAFGSIQFEFNSFDLTAQARETLDTVAKVLNDSRLQGQAFIIEGHTDSVGGGGYNQSLSERRAQAVVSYLVSRHRITADRLRWRGRGESQPFYPSDPAAAVNRRVVILNDQG